LPNPLDVLESRLRNLDALPSKRKAGCVAQARLAMSVVRAFIEYHMDSTGDPRTVRQAVKRIERWFMTRAADILTRLLRASTKLGVTA
jgi:hypothetical protein